MTTIRLSGTDYALLAECQRLEGVHTATAAIRFLLRRWARGAGLNLDAFDALSPPPPVTEEASLKRARGAVAKATPKASAASSSSKPTPKRKAAKG